MKKVLSFVFFLAIAFGASANSYKIDDDAVDDLFATVEVMSTADISYPSLAGTAANSNLAVSSSNVNPWAAWAICWVVGGFGIHRMYLGSDDMMWLYYTVTCGGIFGIVTLVDWVVLLIGAANDDISQYIDNPKFIMW